MSSDTSQIIPGSKLKMKFADGSEKVITINVEGNPDPMNGIISPESPLGQALLGAKQGESRSYKVLDKEFTVKVLEILK